MTLVSKTSLVDDATSFQNTAITTAVKQLAGYDEIIVNATTQDIDVSTYQTRPTTAATTSVANLPAGLFPGQRKVVTLAALGAGGQSLVLTPAAGVTWKQANGNTDCASVTFSAANKFLLVEWNGQRWTNLNTDATVA